ncbi:RagB/SusD family nutrient uptake outer membrane protein [Hyunsoonleella pacifica]|uniref:RagB/SusD family nutrient uptake outer membrane protein n=1 Tax=Hyunsoonleella pacifica TaxID=1080224 RepID=A0A4Q9FSF4_9FLAO|nr:RagB/SusD family nutrient uptake outer membrane protein [Hyunsoonleella pacifica]TBN18923.1 RagB/SusD family nutrient uptake outer membrane protein [Hyunsoonleella pacifica]GGD05893.1 membrane protein [Hyunsoonleella pacifica]
MKSIFKIQNIVLLLGLIFTACESYIEEEFYGGLVAENSINENNADQLVAGMYGNLRAVYKSYGIMFPGTDVFTSQDDVRSNLAINDYFGLTASEGNSAFFWGANYGLTSDANTVINRYENQISWSDANLAVRDNGIAQAKALRALGFYNLVRHFGGIVLELNETNSIRTDYVRSSEEEAFTQIIKDLEEAIPNLGDAPQTGRVSKSAARHLLADVYLTRAYKSFGSASDFTTAASLAEEAIGSYDIRSQTYAQVFDYGNQVNPEVLFAVQYGPGGNFDDRNNNKHGIFMNPVDNYVGIGRANPYGANNTGLMPTPRFFELLANNDSRDEVTLHRVLFADEEGTFTSPEGTDNVVVGDTVVYYPKEPIDAAELADKLNRYWVYQPDQYLFGLPDNVPGVIYQYSSNVLRTNFPIFKKFDDIGIDAENGGSRDTFLFRIAETHLIAAEAHLGAGNTSSALSHLNRVRERATGVANHYTSIDIDTILDERAIELAGEEDRWAILKRTGRLEARIGMYNPHIIDHGAFSAGTHLLRPIPDNEVALSEGSLSQNPNY